MRLKCDETPTIASSALMHADKILRCLKDGETLGSTRIWGKEGGGLRRKIAYHKTHNMTGDLSSSC